MRMNVVGNLLLATGLMAGAGIASAADKNAPQSAYRSDADLAKQVRHELVMYPRLTVWDDLSFRVVNGQVSILGEVTQPFKKSDVARIVHKVPGVVAVNDEVKVLPLSDFDNRLRLQIARAIYSDAAFTQYAMMAVPPIHIIVDNGHVTLTGVVATDFEKNIAGMRANGSGLSFSVTNDLQVERPAKKS